jgi:hypothetical protein
MSQLPPLQPTTPANEWASSTVGALDGQPSTHQPVSTHTPATGLNSLEDSAIQDGSAPALPTHQPASTVLDSLKDGTTHDSAATSTHQPAFGSLSDDKTTQDNTLGATPAGDNAALSTGHTSSGFGAIPGNNAATSTLGSSTHTTEAPSGINDSVFNAPVKTEVSTFDSFPNVPTTAHTSTSTHNQPTGPETNILGEPVKDLPPPRAPEPVETAPLSSLLGGKSETVPSAAAAHTATPVQVAPTQPINAPLSQTTHLSEAAPAPTAYNPNVTSLDRFKEGGATSINPVAGQPLDTPGPNVPGAFPRTLSEAGKSPAGQQAQAVLGSAQEQLSHVASSAAQYLPQSLKERFAHYLRECSNLAPKLYSYLNSHR